MDGKCTDCGFDNVIGSVFCESCGASISGISVARNLRQSNVAMQNKPMGFSHDLLVPGQLLKYRNTYLIEEAIATSGFGATFRATRLPDGLTVLIKQMIFQKDHDVFQSQLRESFRREGKFLMRQRASCFPRGFDYFEKPGVFFLVMEYINGEGLDGLLRSYREKHKKIIPEVVADIGIRISKALLRVHRMGYVYRDLKPANVMIDGVSGELKIIDFGTLYHPTDKNPLIFASEEYTPPEFLDATKQFQPTGDIYSLGVLMYEAATGFIPEKKIVNWYGMEAGLQKIIEKCLMENPERRYPSLAPLIQDLKRLMSGSPSWWPFGKKLQPEFQLSAVPRALFPSSTTFCNVCGSADSNSHSALCGKCGATLTVGVLEYHLFGKQNEYVLYSNETWVGSEVGQGLKINLKSPQKKGLLSFLKLSKNSKSVQKFLNKQFRVFRRKSDMWIESFGSSDLPTAINGRVFEGPVLLKEGDKIQVGELDFYFKLKRAC